MADYIDRGKLIENLNKFAPEYYNELINNLISKQQTEDVALVRYGKWVDTGIPELDLIYSGWKCNLCDYIFCGNKTNYCPICGARMDGD